MQLCGLLKNFRKLKVYKDLADSCLFKVILVLGPPKLVSKDSVTLGTVCSPNMGEWEHLSSKYHHLGHYVPAYIESLLLPHEGHVCQQQEVI